MELGLYNAKYPFRKMINFLLGYFKDTDPNHISLALIPIGLVTAVVYYFAENLPWLYWLGVILIVLRMIVGTLDGMIAENYHKQTANGSIINRLAPEACDMVLLLAIIMANTASLWFASIILIVSWGVSYCGLIGLAGGKKIQSVGPVGQTDRIVALMLFSVLQYYSLHKAWNVNFMTLFLVWVILGGLATIALRCYKTLAESAV